jgi:hypothetical protein
MKLIDVKSRKNLKIKLLVQLKSSYPEYQRMNFIEIFLQIIQI